MLFCLTQKLSICPMCGTTRSGNAQTCSYCGYIYEDQLSMRAGEIEIRQDQTDSDGSVRRLEESALGLDGEDKETLIEMQRQVMTKGQKGIVQGTLLLTKKRIA